MVVHYAEFCSQTQTEFLHMGCPDRGVSSHQCLLRALDYASHCACDRRVCATPRQIFIYAAGGASCVAFFAFFSFAFLAWCIANPKRDYHPRRPRFVWWSRALRRPPSALLASKAHDRVV